MSDLPEQSTKVMRRRAKRVAQLLVTTAVLAGIAVLAAFAGGNLAAGIVIMSFAALTLFTTYAFLIAFIVAADKTFRAAFGRLDAGLPDPFRYRSVHLGMCLFVPLAIVSVPMTVWRLLIWRHSRPLFAWVAVVLAVCELLCIVAAVIAIAFVGVVRDIRDIVNAELALVSLFGLFHFAFTVVADRAIVLLINEMDLSVVVVESKLQTPIQVNWSNQQTANGGEEKRCRTESESESDWINQQTANGGEAKSCRTESED
jgi:hypothetical protein